MAFTPEQKKEWRRRPEVQARNRDYLCQWKKDNPHKILQYSEDRKRKEGKVAQQNKAAGLNADGSTPKQRRRQSHAERLEKSRERGRARARRNREKAIRNLGGKCERCGYDDTSYPGIFAFQVDHVDPVGCSRHRKASQRGIDWAAQGYIEGLQLLCANCHYIKTYTERDHTCRADDGVRQEQRSAEQFDLFSGSWEGPSHSGSSPALHLYTHTVV